MQTADCVCPILTVRGGQREVGRPEGFDGGRPFAARSQHLYFQSVQRGRPQIGHCEDVMVLGEPHKTKCSSVTFHKEQTRGTRPLSGSSPSENRCECTRRAACVSTRRGTATGERVESGRQEGTESGRGEHARVICVSMKRGTAVAVSTDSGVCERRESSRCERVGSNRYEQVETTGVSPRRGAG